MSRRKQKNPSHVPDERNAMTSLGDNVSTHEASSLDDTKVSDEAGPADLSKRTASTKDLQLIECPSCDEKLRSKRAFNSHILIHCQLPNGTPTRKRPSESSHRPMKKCKKTDSVTETSSYHLEDTGAPLDLSYKSPSTSDGYSMEEESLADDTIDDVNNAFRDQMRSFFDEAQNELYLREDFDDSPSTLPLFQSGGASREIQVASGSKPMTYKVLLHSEQVLASRILGINKETGDKMELFKCFFCGVAFFSISRLQAHLLNHKQQFVCKKCNYTCESRLQFSDHVQKTHLLKVYKEENIRLMNEFACDDSNGVENNVPVSELLSALRPDADDHKKPTDEEYSNPSSPSESQGSMETLNKVYTCKFCDKSFDRAFSCNRHERIHTGYKPCYCDMCGRGFSEPRNLRHHVIRFHSDGTLRHLIKRDRRKRSRNSSGIPSSLDNESTVIKKEDPFRSDLRKMISTSLDGSGVLGNSDFLAYDHTEVDNNNELEPGEIRLVGRPKIIEDDEKGRRIVYTDETSDDHSPQFSSYAPRLNIVQDRISRDKALAPITDEYGRIFYECPYCRKFFGSTSDLNRHLDFHEDLRPYDCNYCSYAARTNSQLKVHKMRHQGIKLYTCEVCNYNGVTQSDLNRHKKTQSHTSRCQNTCPICNLGFYSPGQTQVHIMQRHPEMEGASSLIQMSLGASLDGTCKDAKMSDLQANETISVQ